MKRRDSRLIVVAVGMALGTACLPDEDRFMANLEDGYCGLVEDCGLQEDYPVCDERWEQVPDCAIFNQVLAKRCMKDLRKASCDDLEWLLEGPRSLDLLLLQLDTDGTDCYNAYDYSGCEDGRP